MRIWTTTQGPTIQRKHVSRIRIIKKLFHSTSWTMVNNFKIDTFISINWKAKEHTIMGPINLTPWTMYQVKSLAWIQQTVGSKWCHHSRHSALKSKLNLLPMNIFWGYGKSSHISWQEKCTKGCHTTTNIQNNSRMITKWNIWNHLHILVRKWEVVNECYAHAKFAKAHYLSLEPLVNYGRQRTWEILSKYWFAPCINWVPPPVNLNLSLRTEIRLWPPLSSIRRGCGILLYHTYDRIS